MQMNAGNENFIIADGRWSGAHGIGRFSTEILARLQHATIFQHGPAPLSWQNLIWQPRQLNRYKKHYRVFFTPGFNPVTKTKIPFVFTIHDLIHLTEPTFSKQLYYRYLMLPATKHAHKILTVSNYSKQMILQWANIPAEKIINVSCGISQSFKEIGSKPQFPYRYLLHVGNAEKSHKNVNRLLLGFAHARIDGDLRLIFTGQLSKASWEIIRKYRLDERIVVQMGLSEAVLAEYYRGAEAVLFPSLCEGFGLPVLEGMACGVPVLTSNVSSLPEVAGDAALLVEPLDVDSIGEGIEKILHDMALRKDLIAKGLERVKLFSWEKTAGLVQNVLNNSNCAAI